MNGYNLFINKRGLFDEDEDFITERHQIFAFTIKQIQANYLTSIPTKFIRTLSKRHKKYKKQGERTKMSVPHLFKVLA